MSIDQRLRAGLHRSAEAINPGAAAALHAVERTARRRGRAALVVRLAVATAFAAVAAIAGPVAVDRLRGLDSDFASGRAGPLTGTYIVDVANTEPARREGMVGRWVIGLQPDGFVRATPPESYSGDVSGASYATNGDLLRTDAFVSSPGCQRSTRLVGTYRWTRTPSEVRFTAVTDDCPARQVLFGDQPWRVS